ncbi:hypothetical protein FOA52_015234 [Chlamydomonas sp. UWO 241]|nr:hypothetical protein FOA52_015234 [Chlamydomonas sp. UWO 241]
MQLLVGRGGLAQASARRAPKCSAAKQLLPRAGGQSHCAGRGTIVVVFSQSGTHARAGSRPLVVLGIETSCDDTGVAVVTSDGRVLGEAVSRQAHIHQEWGGVVPSLAMQAHEEAIERTVAAALSAAGMTEDQLDAVCVTVGPGLGLCLRVGVTKARSLAREHSLPMVSVHHMEGHALIARLPVGADASAPRPTDVTDRQPAGDVADGVEGAAAAAPAAAAAAPAAGIVWRPAAAPVSAAAAAAASATATPSGRAASSYGPSTSSSGASSSSSSSSGARGFSFPPVMLSQPSVPFPFLCLLVSGGHNLLLLVKGVGQYVQLGSTLDDALGEAYDKTARLLGLQLTPNGGAALERLALSGDPLSFKFSVPMKKHANCDFSFAGLKTSVKLAVEEVVRQADERRAARAASGSSGADGGGEGADVAVEDDAELAAAKANIAASFQYVATLHLTQRLTRAVAWARELSPGLRHLVVSGGVASNKYIRGELASLSAGAGLELVMPPSRWCTDNGVMIAWAGLERMQLGLVEPPPAPLPLPAAGAAAGGADGGAPTDSSVGSASEDIEVEGGGGEEEWVELRPRWPLTAERHPSSAAGTHKSAKRARMFRPLTEMTADALAALHQGQPQL